MRVAANAKSRARRFARALVLRLLQIHLLVGRQGRALVVVFIVVGRQVAVVHLELRRPLLVRDPAVVVHDDMRLEMHYLLLLLPFIHVALEAEADAAYLSAAPPLCFSQSDAHCGQVPDLIRIAIVIANEAIIFPEERRTGGWSASKGAAMNRRALKAALAKERDGKCAGRQAKARGTVAGEHC